MQHKGLSCCPETNDKYNKPSSATSLRGLRAYQQQFANHDDQYYYSEEGESLYYASLHDFGYYQRTDCFYNTHLGTINLLEDCNAIGRHISNIFSF